MKILQRDVGSWGVQLDVTASAQGTQGAPSVTTLKDAEVTTTPVASFYNDYAITNLRPEQELTVTNRTPSIVDSGSLPDIVRLSSGTGVVDYSNGKAKARLSLDLTDQSGGETSRVTDYTPGTWAAWSWAQVEAMLLAGGDANYFNVSYYSPAIAKNAGCWAAGLDLSGVPVSHLSGGFSGGGAAITRRHVWVTYHYGAKTKGHVLKFLGLDGVVYDRTVIGVTESAGFPGWQFDSIQAKYDTMVLTLDSDLPSAVADYPLIGAWASDIDSNGGNYTIYSQGTGVWVDRFRNAHLSNAASPSGMFMFGQSGTINGVSLTGVYQKFPIASEWAKSSAPYYIDGLEPSMITPYVARFKMASDGDSGSPLFFPLGSGAWALATLHTTSTYGAYPFEDMLNACIGSADADAGISTGLTVTVATDPTA